MSEWFLYMVRCVDRSLYTGISTDVERRVKQHNAGKGGAYTRSHRPVKLAWYVKVGEGTIARRWEVALKKMTKGQKEKMVKKWSL